tara:strand:- start:759 stop:1139 length:381 start_codon:yes stop_codon:yes gene_type:complete
MAKDRFGYGNEEIQWMNKKRKDFEYEPDGSWKYTSYMDKKKPRDYLKQNIPYISRNLDNTIMLSKMFESAGSDNWKKIVDSFIRKYDPMNKKDEETGKPIMGADASQFMEHYENASDILGFDINYN